MLKSLPCGRVLISSRRTAGLPEIGKIEVPLEEGQGRGGGLQGPGPPRGTPRRAASARASISARQSRSDVARSRRWGGAAWARGEPGLGAGGGRGGRPAAGDVRGRAVPCCLRRLRPRQPRELQEVRGRCRLFPAPARAVRHRAPPAPRGEASEANARPVQPARGWSPRGSSASAWSSPSHSLFPHPPQSHYSLSRRDLLTFFLYPPSEPAPLLGVVSSRPQEAPQIPAWRPPATPSLCSLEGSSRLAQHSPPTH